MAKIRIEVCMISARGLPRSSSLWKLHWFAVGWIDPMKNKYCSKIDSSGGPIPTWRTKFSVVVDEEKVDLGRLILKMEVRSREAIFLREKLHGVASIPLRGFMERLDGDERRSSSPSSSKGEKVIRSLQLRGRKSGEPRGFMDVSVGIWEEERAGNDASSLTDDYTNSSLPHNRGRQKTSLSMEDGTPITYSDLPSQRQHGETSQSRPSPPPPPQQQQPFIRRRARKTSASSSATTDVYRQANPTTPYRPFDVGRRNEQGPDEDIYTRRPTPPPPPPPSNTGFLPSFFPSTYTTGGVPPPNLAGFGAGVGAGAFAAGAVLFGDDFMSTSGFPN